MVTCPDCGCQFDSRKQLEELFIRLQADEVSRRVTIDINKITKLPRFPTQMGDMIFMNDILAKLELPDGLPVNHETIEVK